MMLYVRVLIQMGTGQWLLHPGTPHYCLRRLVVLRQYFPAFGLREDAFMGEPRLWSVFMSSSVSVWVVHDDG